ncbi:hypothetical protein, partial [Salmonella sp. 17E465]|uniref:hypothetical protein n=1 Tax=Salmonella sp. 17E465 TaxID=2933337 RepID=UPI001FF4F6E5
MIQSKALTGFKSRSRKATRLKAGKSERIAQVIDFKAFFTKRTLVFIFIILYFLCRSNGSVDFLFHLFEW